MAYPEHEPIDPSMIARSRQLRKPMTRMESRLWSVIRNRSLGGFKFRRQFAIGSYVADFACVAAKLIIEIDGYSHEATTLYDVERTAYIERMGYTIIRFTNQELRDNLEGVCEGIKAECAASG